MHKIDEPLLEQWLQNKPFAKINGCLGVLHQTSPKAPGEKMQLLTRVARPACELLLPGSVRATRGDKVPLG